MLWILLIVSVTLYIVYSIFRNVAIIQGLVLKTNTRSAFGFMSDYPKSSTAFILIVLFFSLYNYKNHIYNMYDCSVQKTIHKAANSEYSWYNGECNFQDKNGVFINMQRVRGLPEGSGHDGEDTH